jgi:hypothetical protein
VNNLGDMGVMEEMGEKGEKGEMEISEYIFFENSFG